MGNCPKCNSNNIHKTSANMKLFLYFLCGVFLWVTISSVGSANLEVIITGLAISIILFFVGRSIRFNGYYCKICKNVWQKTDFE